LISRATPAILRLDISCASWESDTDNRLALRLKVNPMNKYLVVAMLALPASAVAPAVALAGGGAGFNPGTVVGNVYQNPEAGYGYGMASGFGLPQTPYYDTCRYASGTRCHPPRHGYVKVPE
jgi:hypothetical protein